MEDFCHFGKCSEGVIDARVVLVEVEPTCSRLLQRPDHRQFHRSNLG